MGIIYICICDGGTLKNKQRSGNILTTLCYEIYGRKFRLFKIENMGFFLLCQSYNRSQIFDNAGKNIADTLDMKNAKKWKYLRVVSYVLVHAVHTSNVRNIHLYIYFRVVHSWGSMQDFLARLSPILLLHAQFCSPSKNCFCQ